MFDGFLRGIYICVCVGECEIDLKREVGMRGVYMLSDASFDADERVHFRR